MDKFWLYTQPMDSGFSFTKLKDCAAGVLGFLDTSIEDLEHEKYGTNIIKIIENYR